MATASTTDYEVRDFQTDVIDASRERPVLVDFWAPWCGPCRTLGPTLESLAEEHADEWTLVKINTDVHQQLAAQYQIRGIPAVKLFADGEVVDEFTGVLPRYAIEQWLEKALPSEHRARVEQAERAMSAGDVDEAEELLRDVLAAEPNDPKARVLLAQLVVFDEPETAAEMVTGSAFAGPGFVQTEQAVTTVARLLQLDGAAEALPEGAGRAAYAEGIEALRRRDFDAALAHFIDVVRTDRPYDDDGARKACVALFNLLGPEHPATRKHRRTFDMSLY